MDCDHTLAEAVKAINFQGLEIEILMMVSLVIQVLLAFLAPLRKRKASGFLSVLLWVLYLPATTVSLIVIGLITRVIHIRSIANILAPHILGERLLTIWASFCLVHLGGPDSITSLSVEDNELWLRQAFQLATQVSLTFYVFGLFVYREKKELVLWRLSMLTFLLTNGCIKCIERICALYFASKQGIRSSSYNNKAPMTKDHNYCSGEVEIHDNDEFEIVKHAYFLYENFRAHIAEDILTLNDSRSSVFFLSQHAIIGLRIIEAELNLIYDILHTKVFLMFMKRAFLRIACFLLVLTSLAFLFFFVILDIINRNDMTNYNILLLSVILALFTGAMLLDIASFIGFLFSDWCIVMVVKLLDEKPSKIIKSFLMILQKWLKSRHSRTKTQRWCEMCSSYNLLDCSLNHKFPNKLLKKIVFRQIKDLLIDWIYVQKHRITRPCLEFIFHQLQQKAKQPTGDQHAATKQMSSARGNLVFEDSNDFLHDSMYLQPWTVNIHYGKSLLTWHLATDICYWADLGNYSGNCSANVDHRSLSKQLSDYMAYILLRHPEMVPQLVGTSDEQFEDAKNDIIGVYAASSQSEGNLNEFCTKLLHQQSETIESPSSVFHASCSLAQKLNVHDSKKKWETISNVWVEMLCYAAIRSLPRYNVARLCKGGELITLVWLYMTQLGFLPFKLIK